MGNLEQLIETIDIIKFSNVMNSMDKNSPTYAKDFKEAMNKYVDKVVKLMDNSSIEVVIGALDYFYTYYASIVPLILDKATEKIMRAELIIDRIKGHSVEALKSEIDTVKNIEAIKIMGFNTDKLSVRRKDTSDVILNVVNRFLKDKDIKEWESTVETDFLKFAKNFNKVEKIIFDGNNTPFYNKFDFINRIFLTDDMDPKLLSEILAAMQNNISFVVFDYDPILMEKSYLINEVKGLYKKFPISMFDIDNYNSEEDFEGLDASFKELCELNKDEEDGLRWFFLEFSKVASENPRLLEHLNNQKYFQFYTYKSISDLYEETMDKMRKGSLDIDEKILESLGTYDKFIDRFQEFFDLVVNCDDEHIKKYAMPLLVALIEKLKKENGLDFELKFTREELDNNNGGSYNNRKNVMYVNQYALLGNNNTKGGLALAVDIIFHEVTHAIQVKELKETKTLSYDNLIMAIDLCVVDLGGSAYYRNNYSQISYEIDAREKAYVQTMNLFKPYPDIQALYKETYIESINPLTKYMRRNVFLEQEAYFGIIENFVALINNMLTEGSHKDKDFLNCVFETLDKYPVIKQFFEINKMKKRIYPKSSEYFESKRKEAEKMDDCTQKREQLYSIEAFRYARRLGDYFKEFLWDFDDYKPEYSKRITEEAIINVGEPPSR